MNPLLGLAVGLATSQLAIFCTTVYLHRGITHRGLTMHPVVALPFRFVVWVSTGIRPCEWAGVHRRHHAALDTVDDPHSPARVGFWKVQLLNIVMYHRAAHNRHLVSRYTRDSPENRLDRFVFDHETIGPLLALVTVGEGLHNNHHAVPTAARFSFHPGQLDPSWWFIRMFSRARLLTVRHEGGLLPGRIDERELVSV